MIKAKQKIIRSYRSYGTLDPVYPDDQDLVRGQRKSLNLARKAYHALHLAFVALPILAGIDKFFFFLTDWSAYVDPVFPSALALSSAQFTAGVGAFEIFLGFGVFFKPRVFADILAVWILAVVANLLVQGRYFDIALFNLALAAGACALARLSHAPMDMDYTGLTETPERGREAA